MDVDNERNSIMVGQKFNTRVGNEFGPYCILGEMHVSLQ